MYENVIDHIGRQPMINRNLKGKSERTQNWNH